MPTSENPPVRQQPHIWTGVHKSVDQQWDDVEREPNTQEGDARRGGIQSVHPDSINSSGRPQG